MKNENLETIMGLIVHGGNAKSCAMEAIEYAKEGKFADSQAKIKDAESSLTLAHNSQTQLLTDEANGDGTDISLLTVHSQDHLMTSIAFTDLAKELIAVYEYIDQTVASLKS